MRYVVTMEKREHETEPISAESASDALSQACKMYGSGWEPVVVREDGGEGRVFQVFHYYPTCQKHLVGEDVVEIDSDGNAACLTCGYVVNEASGI